MRITVNRARFFDVTSLVGNEQERTRGEAQKGGAAMAGKLFPLVLLPRMTTLVGAGDFRTIGMDGSAFEGATVHVWRGALRGTSPTILVAFEESDDQVVWTECDGGEEFAPAAETETAVELEFARRHLRAVVTLGGANVAVSLFAVGHLISRSIKRDGGAVPE
jgi:hypothetical protein